jgi:hypothetical protein
MRTTTAYAFRSGQIGFIPGSQPVPDGALVIAKGPTEIVRSVVQGAARLAYDNQTWLVPGCPEAENENAAYDAFIRFFERIRDHMARRTDGYAQQRTDEVSK